MLANLFKTRIDRLCLATVMTVLVVFSQGCRQDPATEPKYYARELEQMRREEQRAAAAASEKTLKDGYPWRGKTKENPCMPCRIKITDRELTAEIKYLHETVHGKKKTRLRLRD